MFAGNIGDSQDFESILKAAKLTMHENINWILVGDGRKVSWIKSEIEKYNLSNVHLLGRYPINKMPAFFKKADAMLVSLKNSPTFSLTVPAKVQAYMASSKIILGMFNGEGQQIINQSGCGYAVNAGDFIGLIEAVKKMKALTNAEKIVMEEKSKLHYLNNFSKEQLFNQLEKEFLN